MRPSFLSELHTATVNQQLASMSLRQKLAQMLHVPAWSNRDEAHLQDLMDLVGTYGIGGITFFQGTPEAQLSMTQRLQEASNIPLMISIDAEWGLAMRLQNSSQLPYAMTLGAAAQPDITHQLASELGQQCASLGIHVNFAPAVDLNTEPTNPVIGFRSLGADKHAVVAQAQAYATGLLSQGVLPVIKHFPGHGDTHQDSHLTLPTLPHSMERLQEIELAPFVDMIAKGIAGVMTAHLQVPILDDRPNRPATLSQPIIQQLLKEKMGFEGLVFTDALDMGAVAEHYTPAEAALEAVKAGNDILIFCTDVPGALDKLEGAVHAGEIPEQQIEISVRKQLAAKHFLRAKQADTPTEIPQEAASFSPQLIEIYTKALRPHGNQALFSEKTYTCISLQVDQALDSLKHHQLTLTGSGDAEDKSVFESSLIADSDGKVVPFQAGKTSSDTPVIISLLGLSPKAGLSYGLSEAFLTQLRELIGSRDAFVVLFGRDQAWNLIEGKVGKVTGLTAWQDTAESQQAAAHYVLQQLT